MMSAMQDERDSKGQSTEEPISGGRELELLERLWARDPMPEDEAMALAVEAQHATRRLQH